MKTQIESMGMTEKQYYQLIGTFLDVKVKNANQFYKAMKKYAQKELKAQYGSNYKTTAKVIRSEKLTGSDLERFKNECASYMRRNFAVSNPESLIPLSKIKDAYRVEVEASIKGRNGSDSETMTLYCVKTGGKWKVALMGDANFSLF